MKMDMKMDLLTIVLIVLGSSLAYVTLATDENKCTEYQIIEKLTNFQSRIARLEQQQRPAVSAYVRLSETISLGTSERVKYDIEITNVGGAYNFETYQFTAPVPGLYMVSVTVCARKPNLINLAIVKDELKINAVRAGNETFVDCSSGTLSIHLEEGDNIWVAQGEPSFGLFELFEGRGWNTFMATLIQAD